jgi:hypothetical protein
MRRNEFRALNFWTKLSPPSPLPFQGRGPRCAKRTSLVGKPSRGGLGKPLGRGEVRLAFTGFMGWVGVRACLKTTRDAVAKDFGRGQGGEVGASPQRAVTTELTRATGKRPAAPRVFSKRPSGFVAPQSKIHEGYSLVPVRKHSRLAIRPFAAKQHPRVVFKQALRGENLQYLPIMYGNLYHSTSWETMSKIFFSRCASMRPRSPRLRR